MKTVDEKGKEIREEELLYLAGLSWEMDKMEEYQEEHQFSERFEERQKRIIENASATVAKGRKKMSKKKWIVLTAAAVLATGLTITAVASSIFGVENLLVEDKINPVTEVEHETQNDEGETVTVKEKEVFNFIARAIEGSNEFRADQEWAAYYKETLNSERRMAAVAQNDENGKPEELQKYSSAYDVQDQTDAAKVDEILQKYGLNPVSEPETVQSYEEILEKTGTGDFLADKESIKFHHARTFQEGSFNGDIEVFMKLELDKESIGGQISVSREGVFTGLLLNMGDLSDYEEWEYTNKNGDNLNLMINNVEKHSYIFYQGEHNFVIVHMMDNWPEGVSRWVGGGYINEATGEPSEGPVSLTKEELENVADMIDFSVF